MSFTSEMLVIGIPYMFGVMSPGADYVLIVRNSTISTRTTGLFTAIGLGFGIFIHNTYSILGFGLFINQYPIILKVIKYVGAAYLTYIAIQCFKARKQTVEKHAKEKHHLITKQQAFRMGFIAEVTNASAAFFIITLFSDATKMPMTSLLLLGVFLAFLTAAWYGFVAFVLTYPRVQAKFDHYKHWINWAAGCCLVFFALRLVLK